MASKTTFVVGAGASHDFRMPLGADLVEWIRNRLYRDDKDKTPSGGRVLDYAMESHLPGPYGDAARAIAGGLIAARSIDRLLESRKDPLIEVIGKCSIAYCMLEHEATSELRADEDGNWAETHRLLKGASNSWLGKVFSLLQEGVSPADAEDILNNYRFITFNYDRCIERYLRLAYEHILGLPRDIAQNIADAIYVEHVYGSLGELRDGATFRAFGASPKECLEASRLLSTFTEGCEEGRLEKMREEIYSSDKIIFLGFAFDAMNIAALFPHVLEPSVIVGATTYRLDNVTYGLARGAIGGNWVFESPTPCLEYCSSTEFRSLLFS